MLQTQTVTTETLALIKQLMVDPRLNNFTLVGGTALALILGHRKSIDIDLFATNTFDSLQVTAALEQGYGAEFIKSTEGSIQCFIDGVKTDLISHPYPKIKPDEYTEAIRLASLPDIAAMKLHAIVNNGSRIKDFIDVHFLLEKMPLSEMYNAYEEKYYPNASRNIASLGLRDHSRVDMKEPVMYLKENLKWYEIQIRLLQAIEEPNRLFVSGRKQMRQREEAPGSRKKGRRL
ncbi:nucleotidyl transferase AbiEii/AbiGii toxin family protein [Taibaiella helva]|uniref:nucleotidyl transferase AbiEii/AbiGii toxin family protein n=1 Tax=Taibaiella helva TaxID=2301235 RepID=UPI000E5766E8|nr:nucleotidyl transferase AbiEii/AbiGii toxin family protein [Taibaiella helva]